MVKLFALKTSAPVATSSIWQIGGEFLWIFTICLHPTNLTNGFRDWRWSFMLSCFLKIICFHPKQIIKIHIKQFSFLISLGWTSIYDLKATRHPKTHNSPILSSQVMNEFMNFTVFQWITSLFHITLSLFTEYEESRTLIHSRVHMVW